MVNKISSNSIIFQHLEKSEGIVKISTTLEGKTYHFTIIQKDIEKQSPEQIEKQYGGKVAKLIEVAKNIELKKGDQINSQESHFVLTGRKPAELPKTDQQESVAATRRRTPAELPKVVTDSASGRRKPAELPPVKEHSVTANSTTSPQNIKVQDVYRHDMLQAKRTDVEKTATKAETTEILLNTLCKKLAQGKAKVVWIPKHVTEETKHLENKVVYTPVPTGFLNSVLSLNEKEIREEIELQQTLKNNAQAVLGYAEPRYIAVDMEIMKSQNGRFIAVGEKAEGDLEKLISKEQSLMDAAKLGLGYIRGMDELADLGYAAGDVKPENALGYKTGTQDSGSETTVKLADLGKARKVDDKTDIYSGNPRFAPPEGKLSKAGDVFGLGMVSLRVLEERVLAKTGKTMINVTYPQGKTPDFTKARGRGIEKFRVGDPAFPNDHLAIWMPKTAANLQLQENKMRSYVDAFEKEFVGNFPDDPMSHHIHAYCELVKETFNSDPAKRPTAKQFKERYESFLASVEATASSL